MRILFVIACFCSAISAYASDFTVSPIHLYLSRKNSSALLTVHNSGTEEIRLQVSVFDWSEGSDGKSNLKPTQDIIFFPALLVLGSGQERRIRLGSSTPVTNVEKTYRIFVEEMPPPKKPKKDKTEVNIRVLTRMAIPIFLTPESSQALPKLENTSVTKKKFVFQLKNGGNAHFLAQKVVVRALSDPHRVLFEKELPAWYVLAGGQRNYEVDVPPSNCAQIRSFAIYVQTETGGVDQKFETPQGACLL